MKHENTYLSLVRVSFTPKDDEAGLKTAHQEYQVRPKSLSS